MNVLRLGIAGFGRLARESYVPALRALPGVMLVAVADPLSASQAAASRVPGVRIYDALPAMLADAGLDGVLVASPPSTHLAAWRAAAAAGVAVFMEKPLVLSHELDALDGGADGARLMIDFNRRFWPPYARARALVAAGAVGRPAAVHFQLHLDVLGWSTVTPHRLSEAEGGLLHDLGCHAIDLATWILDEEPDRVAAVASTVRWPGDRVRLELGFPSGAVATADLAYGDRTRERLAIEGPSGRIRLDEPNLALHVERGGTRPSAIVERCRDVAVLVYRAMRPSERVGRGSIRGAIAAFVAAAETGGTFDPGIADAVGNARLIAAAGRSATAGGDPMRPSNVGMPS